MRRVVTNLEPKWFVAVMGTGMIALGGSKLTVPGARVISWVALALAAVLLAFLLVGTLARIRMAPGTVRDEADDDSQRPYAGALPIALLTVSSATGSLVPSLLGVTVTLWVAGAALGLVTAAAVPAALLARGEISPSVLLPVAPPIVAASTGAPLLAELPAGQVQLSGLVVLYGVTGASLLLGATVTVLVVGSVAGEGGFKGQARPSVWIVLSLLGQGVVALTLLGSQAVATLGDEQGLVLRGGGTLLAMLLWGTGAGVLILVIVLSVNELREGLSFGLAWWSFTYPLGSAVTASDGLAAALDSAMLRGAAAGLWVALIVVWTSVTVGTVRGVANGTLLPK